MSTQILLTVPDEIYHQVETFAGSTQRNIAELLLETITRTFSPTPADTNRSLMNKNVTAYKTLHPQLTKQYPGQFVAIYNGQLIDHDPDPIILLQRIRSKYPGQVVLRRKVEAIAERELRIRNPRIEAML